MSISLASFFQTYQTQINEWFSDTLNYYSENNDQTNLNLATSTYQSIVNGTTFKDAVEPVFKSASSNGNKIVIQYNETLNTFNIPVASAFTVKTAGADNVVTNVVVDAAACTVTLTLTTDTTGQEVTLAYDYLTTGNDTKAIQDTAGNNAASFDAKRISQDITKPTFAATTSTPADNAAGVNVASNITLDFSESVVIADAAGIKLYDTAGNAVAANVSVINDNVIINPTANLANNTGYYVQVSATAITDIAGNKFAGIADAKTFNFTTTVVAAGDTTAPTFAPATSTPADNATGVAIANNITLDFSEAVVIADATGIKLFKSDGTQITTATPSVVNGDIVIDPTADLDNNTGYYVQIAATAVKDLSNNLFAGIADTETFNFTTAAAGIIPIPVGSVLEYKATANSADKYSFDVDSALKAGNDAAGDNIVTQASISGFAKAEDSLSFDFATADPDIKTLDKLDGYKNITVQEGPKGVVINFGNDNMGNGDVVTITLLGIKPDDLGAINIAVV